MADIKLSTKTRSAVFLLLLSGFIFSPGILWAQFTLEQEPVAEMLPVIGHYKNVCIQNVLPKFYLPAIAIGCGITDCCPSCPAIDAPWDEGALIEVTITGANEDAVSLRFENLTPNQVRSLGIPHSQYVTETEVKVPAGVTRIRVPPDFPGAILITPVINLTDESNGGDHNPLDGDPEAVTPGQLKVDFESVLSELDLGKYGYVTDFDPCYPPTIPTCLDTIVLDNHTDSEPAVVLLDGHTDFGCVNDVVESGKAEIPVGNFLEPYVCRNEAVVFARDKAMHIFDDADSDDWSLWTNQAGDKQPFTLDEPRVELPLNIQLAVSADLVDETLGWAVQDSLAAETIMLGNRMGIDLEGTDLNDIVTVTQANEVSAIEALIAPWIFGTPTCQQVVQLVNDLSALGDVYDPDKLNIYYVDAEFLSGVHFRYCPADPDNQPQGISTGVIFVGRGSSATTFTHEIGHALSLGHVGFRCPAGFPCGFDYNTDGFRDFNTDNLMFVDFPDDRLFFSEGQVFRANANETSLLNSGTYRSGEPTRNCAEWRRNDICPWLGLDSYQP